MKRLPPIVAALGGCALLSVTLGFAGCGGDDTAADPCFDYSTFTPSTVTFKADVLPIFRNSCGLSMSCHGDASSPKTLLGKQPYLGNPNGPEMMPSEIQAVIDAIVGETAEKEPSMKEVTPSDPQKSFLMYKVDQTLSCPSLPCASGGACGSPMPNNGDPLPLDQRNKIRSWIAAGAKND
jgi:hypothetical protein